ncbi:two-component system response regulator [Halomonas sp. 1513]|nr:HD domain-containing phosphohydrolase [Halomonas sp. 1513]APX95106.1 two-component system response regulator [Halomonas sp. 1513]
MNDTSALTLLAVDDEPNILRTLKRVLRHEPYRVLTAESGSQALEIMHAEAVDLIISDARMPEMDGAELLARVQRRWPECVRILFTGYADLTSTVRAINEGKIYRYIAKPWNDDELRLTLSQALAHLHTERERKRLEALTQAQNEELVALNASLEQRVRDRTEELQQTADMLDVAYAELKQSYVTATRVFSSLINLRLPRHCQTNAQVGDLIKAFAETQQLDEALTRDLSMAAALYNLGKLTWEDRLFKQPYDLLYREDREVYRSYPATGESLLMSLEPLQDAAQIIRHHQERWNGTGFPNRLSGAEIPYGARLLKLAVDFIELQQGMVLDHRVLRDEALALLRKYAGRTYDPEMCEAFVEMCIDKAPDLGLADNSVLVLDTRRVEPGMVLVRDLHSDAGMLLLNEGKELSTGLIEKLMRFEESEDTRYTLLVRPPDPAA